MENEWLPNTLHKVATPQTIAVLPHVSHLANRYLPLKVGAMVGVLVGRNNPLLMSSIQHGTRLP